MSKFPTGKLKVYINVFTALIVPLTRLVTENSKGEKLFPCVHKHPRKVIVPNSNNEFLKKWQSGDNWKIKIQ